MKPASSANEAGFVGHRSLLRFFTQFLESISVFEKNLSLAYFNISLSKKVAFWLRATPGVIL